MVTDTAPIAQQNDCARADTLGFIVNDIARLMRRAFDRRVRRLGLTRAQWLVLAHLRRTDGQTQTHLAEELDMEKAPLGRLLDRLERGGWIERRRCPGDGRANRVYKTAKIDPLVADMSAESEALTQSCLVGLCADEQEHLMAMLRQIRCNLLRYEVAGGGGETGETEREGEAAAQPG